MIRSFLKTVVAVFVFWLVPLPIVAQSITPTEIKIVSSWTGLGPWARDELIITRKGTNYYTDGKEVDAQLVRNLIDALNAPVIPRIDLSNLGITQAWLDANAEQGVKEYADVYYSSSAPNLQALYLSTFKNLNLMKSEVASLYTRRWTDDYPRLEIKVTTADGTKLFATSEVQQLLMLPWKITRNGQESKSYDANIARAVAPLLPEKFANKERLSSEGLSRVLAEAVMWRIRDQWQFLDAENQTGNYLRAIKETFVVQAAEVNSLHSLDFGKEWLNGDSAVMNLQATLKRKDLPKNLRVGIALPFKDGEVGGVDSFLSEIDRYLKLVRSVPWLTRFMRSQPDAIFELRYVGDRSFSEKAMEIFAADMRLANKKSVVKQVEALQKDVSLLVVLARGNRDYWLILPDRRVVFWRFYSVGSPVKWEALKSSAWKCSNYGDKCVGAIVSTTGKPDMRREPRRVSHE